MFGGDLLKSIKSFFCGMVLGMAALIVLAYCMNNNKGCLKKKANKTINIAEGMLDNMKNAIKKA